MNAILDEERLIFINSLIKKFTDPPVYENDVEGEEPDFIFIEIIVHFDNYKNLNKYPTVTLKFQSTFDNKYLYLVIDHKYETYTMEEI